MERMMDVVTLFADLPEMGFQFRRREQYRLTGLGMHILNYTTPELHQNKSRKTEEPAASADIDLQKPGRLKSLY